VLLRLFVFFVSSPRIVVLANFRLVFVRLFLDRPKCAVRVSLVRDSRWRIFDFVVVAALLLILLGSPSIIVLIRFIPHRALT